MKGHFKKLSKSTYWFKQKVSIKPFIFYLYVCRLILFKTHFFWYANILEWFWWLLHITYTYSSDTFFKYFFQVHLYIHITNILYIYIYIYKWSYVIHDTQNPQEEVRYGVMYIESILVETINIIYHILPCNNYNT